MALADRIVGVESGGNPYAANPRSTARGLGQFIEATWLEMLAKHRPDLITGKSRDELLALRNDPALSRAMTEAYAADNTAKLRAAGLPVTPGTTYLAHFAGPQGAVSLLNADPTAPVGSVLGEAAMKANPFLKNMTVADLRAMADTKMGGQAPQAMPQQPMNISPDLSGEPFTPFVPGNNQTAPNPAAMMAAFGSMAPPKMEIEPPPMPVPIRPQVDLSRLRAALQRAPTPGAFLHGWA